MARLTHSSISLCDTAPHAAEEAANSWAHSHARRGRLNLRRGEEKHTALRRSLDPRLNRNQRGKYPDIGNTRPRNETLEKADKAAASPNGLQRLRHRLRPVRGHLGFNDLQRLAEGRDLRGPPVSG